MSRDHEIIDTMLAANAGVRSPHRIGTPLDFSHADTANAPPTTETITAMKFSEWRTLGNLSAVKIPLSPRTNGNSRFAAQADER
jgi:hypothetical protein